MLPCLLSAVWLPNALHLVSSAAADPLVGSIAQQLLTDKEGHNKTASEWTRRYAQG